MRNYQDYLNRKRAEHGAKFDTADLNPDFIRYFESGQRIKIRFQCGLVFSEMFGTVGVTTGWKPVFLLMSNRSAAESSTTIGNDCKVVAVKIGKTYRAV